MKATLISRLERLEARSAVQKPVKFRYGRVRRLPHDFTGERHVVVVKSEPTRSPDVEWCEFEERAGPAPAGLLSVDMSFNVYLAAGEGTLEGEGRR